MMNKQLLTKVFLIVLFVQCLFYKNVFSGSNKYDSIYCISKNAKQLNDIAKFIAAIPLDSSSILYRLTQTPEWGKYSKQSNLSWDKFEAVGKKYKKFSEEEIAFPYDTISTLFYPFSGPDFLFSNLLFPNVQKMIFIGLESPGSIPTFSKDEKKLSQKLFLYTKAIEDIMQLSFFRTVDMKVELSSEEIDGVTPILKLFLAHSRKIIDSICFGELDKEGKISFNIKKGKQPTLVVIYYHNEGDTTQRTITYLSTNLADPSLKKNKPFVNYLNNIDNNCITFIKSATYLMHKSYFSIIRNTCLNHSAIIIQDDSGIAFKYFDQNLWDIQLYGVYNKPIKLFEEFYEPELKDAYEKNKPKPLPFRIGYNNVSNMLIAKKKNFINN